MSPTLGQVTNVLLTRPPLSPCTSTGFPFDLHVLGTPPALILSQDQTLRKISRYSYLSLFLRVPSLNFLRCVPVTLQLLRSEANKNRHPSSWRRLRPSSLFITCLDTGSISNTNGQSISLSPERLSLYHFLPYLSNPCFTSRARLKLINREDKKGSSWQ